VESMVDPLGDGLTSVLPEGLAVAAFGLPIAPGLDWPVVVPGGFPAGGTPPADEPAVLAPPDVPAPALPPAPPAPAVCASAIELESASALTSAIVANFFIGCFPWLVVPG
jgi:hypothetical protein